MAAHDPLDGKLVAMTGGSGFLGRHVAQALLERGARVRIASREPNKAFSLRPLANLGQIEFMRCDVRDRAQAAAAVRGADAVVNLVGSFEGDLMRLICGGALHVAEAARDSAVNALVHVSAILDALAHVMPDPRVIPISPLTGVGVKDWITWLTMSRDAMLAVTEVSA